MNQSTPIQSAAVLASCEAKWAERCEALQAEVARLGVWVLDGREACIELLSYDPCRCDRKGCKKCRNQNTAKAFLKATDEFAMTAATKPERKETNAPIN